MNQHRKFGLTVGSAFLVLAGIMWWRGHLTGRWVTGGIGTFLLVAAMVAPAVLRPVERVWMAMAHGISRVTTPLFMGLVYYLSVLPIGLIMRAGGRNPMTRREKDGTFWVDRADDGPLKSDLSRQF